jgi:hypothetical protein
MRSSKEDEMSKRPEKATDQKFLRAILKLIVESDGIRHERIAAELRAQGEVFTNEELECACDLLYENGYTERPVLQ